MAHFPACQWGMNPRQGTETFRGCASQVDDDVSQWGMNPRQGTETNA